MSADRDQCVGSGQCVRRAPEVFDQHEDDGLVIVLAREPAAGALARVRQAVAECPAGALRLAE